MIFPTAEVVDTSAALSQPEEAENAPSAVSQSQGAKTGAANAGMTTEPKRAG